MKTLIILVIALSILFIASVVTILIMKKKNNINRDDNSKSDSQTTELSDNDIIKSEGLKALSEMGRIYSSVKDDDIRKKINELMRLTDKIIQDADADPTDIPAIKKFIKIYLPTTIKLLNSYDRMTNQETDGENITKSMESISQMLDDSIEAYTKMLDSLFANQALDIQTDIEVMNNLLAREGLSGEKDFKV